MLPEPGPGYEDDDKPHEECGIFGVWNVPDAAALTALGLHALQHRGQEATGLVSFDGQRFYQHRGLGLVADTFGDARVIASLPGGAAVGHNRYATTGETVLRNVQPLYADFEFGGLAVSHNGNLTNALALKRQLVRRGCLFQSTTDSEVFVHLIAISLYSTVVDRLIDALKQVVGAYSLICLSNEAMLGVRDPLGVRPLILGRVGPSDGAGGWVLASETCALDIVGAEFVRDVEPGEIVVINDKGVHSIKPFGANSGRFCVFEYIYFARPDSVVEGTPVYEARKRIGEALAAESAVAADVVVPVPDSGVPSAMGYAEASGLPFELGIIRNHYVGRTFIEPTDQIRNLGVKLKHSANKRGAEGQAGHPGGRLDRARHHQPQDRRDGARGRGGGGAHADLVAAHDAFLLLRHRHAGAGQAAGGAARRGGDGPADRRRQPGVHQPGRAVWRTRQGRRAWRAQGLLRRLLHRRIPDRPVRPAQRGRAPAQPASRAVTGRIAFVTGASRGIGAAVAVELARAGHHVVLTARTQGGLEETDDAVREAGGTATLLPLDLADGGQLDSVGPSLLERFGRLDTVVHAAGALGKLTPAPHILPRDFDATAAVNVAAAWRLIRTCGPLLLAGEAGRAVFITDSLVNHPRAYWGLYGATKAAMHHLALSWAEEVRNTRCRVNLFDPGIVATRLRAEAMPGEDASKLTTPAQVAPAIARLCQPDHAGNGAIVLF